MDSQLPDNLSRERKPRAPNAPPSTRGRTASRAGKRNSDIVYEDLKRDIVGMVLAPGTPVLEKDLTQRFGISRTPVREAVLRLSDERLLEVVPKSGTFVARISISVLREALVARRALEAVTVRAAARNATQDQIIELKAIIQSQRKHAEAGDEEAFHRADEAFHAGLAETGNYRGIWVIIQQVKMHIDRYRLLTLPQPGRMMLVLDEHSSVLDAVQDGDADRAVAQMEAHLNKLRLDIAVFRDIWPDYFIHDLPMGDDTAN